VADKKYVYTYTNTSGVQVNIVLSENVAAVGGFVSGQAGKGKFGPISRRNYPYSIYGVNVESGETRRVRIPFPSAEAWSTFVAANTTFNYTGQDGVARTYKITSWEGEKNVFDQFAP